MLVCIICVELSENNLWKVNVYAYKLHIGSDRWGQVLMCEISLAGIGNIGKLEMVEKTSFIGNST